MEKAVTMKAYRTIEYMEKNGTLYKKTKKAEFCDLSACPNPINVFNTAMDKLRDEYIGKELAKMNVCEEVERTENKMVLYIKKVLTFEYDVRITFELK